MFSGTFCLSVVVSCLLAGSSCYRNLTDWLNCQNRETCVSRLRTHTHIHSNSITLHTHTHTPDDLYRTKRRTHHKIELSPKHHQHRTIRSITDKNVCLIIIVSIMGSMELEYLKIFSALHVLSECSFSSISKSTITKVIICRKFRITVLLILISKYHNSFSTI